MNRSLSHCSLLLAAAVLGGCASAPDTATRDTRAAIAARTGYPAVPDSGAEADRQVEALFAKPLGADGAAQAALLNNPSLRADFEEIGIAQADLLEAGLLRNPVLDLGLGFPSSPPSATRIDISITQSVLDLLTRAPRRAVSAAKLEAVKLRIADEALGLAAGAKKAVYQLQADELLAARLTEALDLERSSAELAGLQKDAGNIAELDLLQRQASYSEVELASKRNQAELQAHREQLNRILGPGAERCPGVEPALPPVPEEAFSAAALEASALERRLDLAAARAEVESAARSLGLSARFPLARSLEAGAQFERDVDGQKTFGPKLAAEVPIFDTGAARLRRSQALARQATERLKSVEASARSEIRESLQRLSAARDLDLLYEKTVAPQRRRLFRLIFERYNGMLAGAYDLILAKQNELAADRSEIEARREYWTARADLERAAGGGLPSATLSPHLP